MAESLEYRKANPHEFRLGWGDPIMEVALGDGHTSLYIPETGNIEKFNSRNYSTGHIFMEYSYRFNPHLSFGMKFDVLPQWTKLNPPYVSSDNVVTSRLSSCRFSFIPTLRYTYFNTDLVSLYSSVGIGFGVSSFFDEYSGQSYIIDGNKPLYYYEINNMLHAVVDVTLLGVSVGKGHWFGSFEIGTTLSLATDQQLTRVAPGAFVRVSVGYRF